MKDPPRLGLAKVALFVAVVSWALLLIPVRIGSIDFNIILGTLVGFLAHVLGWLCAFRKDRPDAWAIILTVLITMPFLLCVISGMLFRSIYEDIAIQK